MHNKEFVVYEAYSSMVEQKSIIFPSRSTQSFKICSGVYCRKNSSGTKQLLSLEMSLSDFCYYIIPHLSLCYNRRHLVPSLSSLSSYLWPVEDSPRSPGLGLCPRDRAQVCCQQWQECFLSIGGYRKAYTAGMCSCLGCQALVLSPDPTEKCLAGLSLPPQIRCLWTQTGSSVRREELVLTLGSSLQRGAFVGSVHRVGDRGRADVKTACDKGTQT